MRKKESTELLQSELRRELTPFEEAERWFEAAFRRPFSLFSHRWPRFRALEMEEVSPSMDIFEEDGNVVVKAELPGIKKEDVEVTVTCSIGIASYPRHGDRHQLPSHAVAAMRAAKRQGGCAFAEYDQRMGEDMREQLELMRDLRMAVDKRQLELFYQPKVDAESLQVTAVEALLRWHHPTRGIVSPALFIPIAERQRLIGQIGNWVIDEATSQAAAWRDMGLRMRVAINVSGYQMRQDDFAERLEHSLRSNRPQPGRFTCEITETVAMEDTRVTKEAFERLRRLGGSRSIRCRP